MRTAQRNAFRLTTERKAILQRLLTYRYLRTSHFYSFFGAGTEVSDRAVRRLLHDFLEHGYLRRRASISVLDASTLPRHEYVYWLSPAGVDLARDCGFCGEDFPEMAGRSSRTLEHDVAITDFHLAVERFCWGSGWSLFWQQHSLRRGVNPDALFALTDPRRPIDANTAYYFLELERSAPASHREGRSAFWRRLQHYAAYQGSTECARDWEWFSEFRLVIVVASEARRRHLLAKLSAELPLPMFWLAVEGADFMKAPFRSPTDHASRDYSFLD